MFFNLSPNKKNYNPITLPQNTLCYIPCLDFEKVKPEIKIIKNKFAIIIKEYRSSRNFVNIENKP